MVHGDIFDYFGLDLGPEELRAKGYRVWTHEDASFGGWGGRNAADTDAGGVSPRDYATAR